MINVNYCCFDASAFSLGFASAHGGTLLLEKSENALSDYVNAVIPSRITVPRTDKGRAFADFLKKSGCVSDDGTLDSPSLAPAAAEYALDFNIILNTNIVFSEKKNDGYNVLIHTNSGLQNVFCKQIVNQPAKLNSIKFLNCIVSDTDYETLSKIEASGTIIHNSFEKDEFIVSMPFEPDCKFNEARIQFVEQMRKYFGTSVKIDAFAADFAGNPPYGDIIRDFEAGVEFDI